VFVELAARTNFSMLRGGSPPKGLIERAAELGYGTVGIADCDGLYGMVRALEAAEEAGVRLVVGCEVAIDDDPVRALWLHVATLEGYANICRLLTESHARHPKGHPRKPDDGVPRNQFAGVPIDRVCAFAPGLWCLVPPEGSACIGRLKDAFGERLSIAAWRHFDGEDAARMCRVEAVARDFGAPVCATNRVLFAAPVDKPVFDVLHCIREGISLDDAGRALLPNAEAHLKSPADMQRLFSDRPAWLERAGEIAHACHFSLREIRYEFPYERDSAATGSGGETADCALRRLTYEGAKNRYAQGVPDAVRAQVDKELALIAEMDVARYFLSVRSIVEIARSRDILCQGRGSAANSAVCYCLGITAVDPARSHLLFERFLSNERREPPDIDVDFEHERREEVIQAIYDQYTRDRAAMVSEVISYRGKSALRDVGKVFGLSLEQVDRLSGLVAWWDKLDEVPEERIVAFGFDPRDARVRHVLRIAHAIEGYPRHLSIHVGGFVLSAEPLTNVAPIEPATMPGRTIIPWDKDDLDTLGFFKVDVLGLGMLTAIRKALAYAQVDARVVADNAIDRLARVPAEDPRVYDALCMADTVGVFQIESRAQMAMLPRLQPRRFYDLVVEVAIVRPGPIQGGMVHPYLRRRTGEEPVDVPHPTLAPILERTLGVPLFQEQVMQIAIAGAGTPGGRRTSSGATWRHGAGMVISRAIDPVCSKGLRVTGSHASSASASTSQIEGFGEYGFPESHAASFALLVYVSAWLKVHHPAAFAAALINSQPMGFYSSGTIVSDAERHGVEVVPARVDASDWDCTLVGGDPAIDGDSPALQLGLRVVRGLGQESGKRIERARRERPFVSVEDLVARARMGKGDIEALAHAGALSSFGLGRREAMWKVRAPRERGLLAGVELDVETPDLPPMSRAEQLTLDYETTGVAVGDHAMSVVRPSLPARCKTAHELSRLSHGDRVSTAGLVICRQRPATASGVVFITLEDETGFVNLILWARTFERWRHVATTSSIVMVHGAIEKQGAVVYVVVQRLEKLGLHGIPAMSRDFH
jgi:error-prone DNA polymerase